MDYLCGMQRIIGIDYGKKRTGLAVTDPLGIIATPLTTILSSDLLKYLQQYVTRENVSEVVIGMPRTLSNEDSSNAEDVRKFIHTLRKALPNLTIHTIDERFTTSLALDTMIRGGMKKKDRRDKGNLDKISATIILQSFLEQRRV